MTTDLALQTLALTQRHQRALERTLERWDPQGDNAGIDPHAINERAWVLLQRERYLCEFIRTLWAKESARRKAA